MYKVGEISRENEDEFLFLNLEIKLIYIYIAKIKEMNTHCGSTNLCHP